jgi:hypothetical protein
MNLALETVNNARNSNPQMGEILALVRESPHPIADNDLIARNSNVLSQTKSCGSIIWD